MHLRELVLLAAIGLLTVSCAPSRTSVVIKQGNPQQFFVSGCGTFDILTISGPDYDGPRHDGVPYSKDYWVIQSTNDIDVSQLPKPIIYGQVPSGFRQYTPKNGPPPPISDGGYYSISLRVRDKTCGGVGMRFIVRNGKINTEVDSD
jgi:hypothetical protein